MSAATPDATFTVPGELHARAEAAYAAYDLAVRRAAGQPSVEHARTLAAARRRLAASYRELASVFTVSAVLFEAFDHMAARHHSDATGDDRWADRLEASNFGGDMQ